MKNKKGNISMILTLVISLAFLIILGVYIINTITPFIWYQKLDNIANKYVYVIEKFGYLKDKEKDELYNDLENAGFNIQNIKLYYPKQKLSFGTLFEFRIEYEMEQKNTLYMNGITSNTRVIPLNIQKYSYSKI